MLQCDTGRSRRLRTVTRAKSWAATLVAAGILGAALALPGCGGSSSPGKASSTSSKVHSYTVRGKVESVATTGPDAPRIVVHHEPVPNFHTVSGDVETMESMRMPFPVAKGVALGPIKPGMKVRFKFKMDWNKGQYQVTSIQPLPPDTKLHFGKATAEHKPAKHRQAKSQPATPSTPSTP